MTVKRTFQTAIISIFGTSVAIAIGFYGIQHIGKRIVFGVSAGLFAGGALAAILHTDKSRSSLKN
jgi:ABC-type branched-subunit amino acid transport system permease subunit